jgi:hypothetical protein
VRGSPEYGLWLVARSGTHKNRRAERPRVQSGLIAGSWAALDGDDTAVCRLDQGSVIGLGLIGV